MVVLDEALVGRIQSRAAELHPGRMLLTVVAALFFALGWTIAKAARGIWLVLSWSIAAARVGWQEGWKAPDSRA
jgi:hypothetical protein